MSFKKLQELTRDFKPLLKDTIEWKKSELQNFIPESYSFFKYTIISAVYN
ncbi:hypothetical protein cco67_06845, partial [Campylobacter coli 1961]